MALLSLSAHASGHYRKEGDETKGGPLDVPDKAGALHCLGWVSDYFNIVTCTIMTRFEQSQPLKQNQLLFTCEEQTLLKPFSSSAAVPQEQALNSFKELGGNALFRQWNSLAGILLKLRM